nr:rpoC gene [Spinacia oleracea]
KLLHSSQIIQERKEFSIFRKVMPFSTNDDTLMRIEDKPFIRKNQLLYRVNFVREKTYDIVQGLPKVEKLLEARMTSSLKEIINNPHDILTESFFTFLDDYENLVRARKSFEVIQKYLIDGVQTVYKSQGVKIADKHIELIVKQITSKVIVTNPGDSSFMVGDFLDLNLVEVLNKRLVNSIVYEPIIMGLTRFSLSSQSFIAQASFQETTRVLTKAALQGRADWLSGLKENLVLGNIIPAGTGFKN